MSDVDWMRLALKEAKQCAEDVPVGAVLVRQGKLIARAHNEREKMRSPIAHAEMLALYRGGKALGTRRLTDCILYVTLEPCPMCAGALLLAGVSKCVFGAFDRQYGCCGSVYALPMDRHFHHAVPCVGGVLEEDCEALLRDFFQSRR